MDTAKVYQDADGNDCTIHQMVKREPEWAANRIQAGEDAITANADLQQRLDTAEEALKVAQGEVKEIAELQGFLKERNDAKRQAVEDTADIEAALHEVADREFITKRMKVLANTLGLGNAMPDDATIYGCLGTVLGMFRASAEQQQSALTAANSRVERLREALRSVRSLPTNEWMHVAHEIVDQALADDAKEEM